MNVLTALAMAFSTEAFGVLGRDSRRCRRLDTIPSGTATRLASAQVASKVEPAKLSAPLRFQREELTVRNFKDSGRLLLLSMWHKSFSKNVKVVTGRGKLHHFRSSPTMMHRQSQGIRDVVLDRRMPPWHADPKYGHFSNDRSLTARERVTLLAWVDQKTPLGDLARLPRPVQFVEGWTISALDVILNMPQSFRVPAEGVLSYQKFRVQTGFHEDVWIQAAESTTWEP